MKLFKKILNELMEQIFILFLLLLILGIYLYVFKNVIDVSVGDAAFFVGVICGLTMFNVFKNELVPDMEWAGKNKYVSFLVSLFLTLGMIEFIIL
jgi:multisubunit Na+/H+ antiporter MnhC subunit